MFTTILYKLEETALTQDVLSAGKIPPALLEKVIFRRTGAKRPEVLVMPAVGEDTTAIDVGGELLVATTDPITGAEEKAGWLAVKVAVNDIAASGAEPLCILMTLLLPESTSVRDLECIMDDVHQACIEENVTVAGGHSEVTPGLSHPIISVTALGRSRGRRILRSSGACVGDDIVVTKWAGMEGTSILVRDFRPVFSRVLDSEEMREAEELLNLISVSRDGRIAAENGATSCHDATEGGVLGAIYEVLEASGTGAVVYADEIPVLPVTVKVSEYTHIDPLKLISSGCLVITTPSGQNLCDIYRKAGINARVVGKITSDKREIICRGQNLPLEAPGTDELWQARRYLENLK